MVNFKFKPQELSQKESIKILDMLPAYLKSKDNKKIFDSIIQPLYEREKTVNVSGYIGQKPKYFDYDHDYYIQEVTSDRLNYQLEPAMVSRNENNDLYTSLFYNDLNNILDKQGSLTKNQSKLFGQEYYSYSPVIDLDKFVNYSNYYWSESGSTTIVQEKFFTELDINTSQNIITIPNFGYNDNLEVKLFTNSTNLPAGLVNGQSYLIKRVNDNSFKLLNLMSDEIDLTSNGSGVFYLQPKTLSSVDFEGKKFASLPDGTPIENGMRIILRNDELSSRNNIPFVFEGVGSNIQMLDDSEFGVGNEYDATGYDITTYDYSGILNDFPDYITIQRGAIDNNLWSKTNRWFHISLLKNNNVSNLNLKQARRPIIEFTKNIELFDHGTVKRTDIDLVYNLGNIQDLTGLSSAIVDNVTVKDGYRILVINDKDPEKNNRIFKVYGLNNTGFISLALETDGNNIFGQPLTGESVFCRFGTVNSGKTRYYDGVTWKLGQQKIKVNQPPLFRLYDNKGISLNDTLEYPESNFTGSTLFQYSIDTNFKTDPVLNLTIKTDNFGKPFFDSTLDSVSYTYISNFIRTEIPSYYFFKVNGLLKNHWHKAPEDSKQKVINEYTLSNSQENTTNIDVTVFAATTSNISGFVSGSGASGENDSFNGVNLNLYFDDITYAKKGSKFLIKDQFNQSENGIFEYVSGSFENAYIVRDKSFDTSLKLFYGKIVFVETGTIFKNTKFVMSQQNHIIWGTTPILWERLIQDDGISRIYQLSQIPKNISDFVVKTSSDNNIDNFISGNNSTGNNDRYMGINLSQEFDSTLSYKVGDLLLVTKQINQVENGIFVFTSGTPEVANITRLVTTIKTDTTVLISEGQRLNEFYLMTQTQTLDYQTIPMTWEIYFKPVNSITVMLNGNLLQRFIDYNIVSNNLTLSLSLNLKTGDILRVLTDGTGILNSNGYYEMPVNLQSNANNLNVSSFNYSDIINHFGTIMINQSNFSGQTIGINNYRNLLVNYGLGLNILQHSAPMLKLMLCCSDENLDIVNALDFQATEYNKFYNKFINKILYLQENGYTDLTNLKTWIADALTQINIGKDETFPFYNNNVAGGNNYIPASPGVLGITPIFQPHFFVDYTTKIPKFLIRLHDGQLASTFSTDFEQQNITTEYNVLSYNLNFPAVNDWEISVMIDNCALTPGIDYTINTGSVFAQLVLKNSCVPGRIIKVYKPKNIVDSVLLAFETLVYENINSKLKQTNLIDSYINFNILEVKPGFFRKTDYSTEEWNKVLAINYNNWLVNNKVTNESVDIFDSTNEFTWNYSGLTDSFGKRLPGHWRGIYLYYYDTDRPHTNPWEMLGFSEKPYWWISTYGYPPYTSANISLWQDIADGRIVKGSRQGIYPFLARKDIFSYLPVDSAGNLKTPSDIGIANTVPLMPIADQITTGFEKYANAPFVFGDMGPVEYAWFRSANYAHSLAKTLYLLKPARFTEYFWDTAALVRIFPDTKENQLVSVYTSKRATNNLIPVHNIDNYVSSGIQQYIIDALKFKGKSPEYLKERLYNLDSQLGYKVGGFIDTQSLTATVDSFGSNNTSVGSLIIPNINYNVNLYVSKAIKQLRYSGLVVTRNSDYYYEISGYDNLNQVFEFYKPIKTSTGVEVNVGGVNPTLNDWTPNSYYSTNIYVSHEMNKYVCIVEHFSSGTFDETKWKRVYVLPKIGGISVTKYSTYEKTLSIIPYNKKFFSIQELADFVYGYEEYLIRYGWKFTDIIDNDKILNFSYLFNQILLWAQDKKASDVVIISPMSNIAVLDSKFGYISDINNKLLNKPTAVDRLGNNIDSSKMIITRYDNNFSLSVAPSNLTQRIHGLNLFVETIEHVVYFDNYTEFNDLIYDSLYNIRQPRIKLRFNKAGDWNGKFYAPGYIITNTTISNNFEKSVNDIKKFYNSDELLRGSQASLAVKSVFGFNLQENLTNLLMDERDQFQLYTKMIRQKGTTKAFNKLFRNDYISNIGNSQLYEEWAIRLGNYGALDNDSVIELKINDYDIKSNPQIVRFVDTVDNVYDKFIDINPIDPRFLTKRFNNLTNNQFKTIPEYTNLYKLPTAGYLTAYDANILVSHYLNLSEVFKNYILTTGNIVNNLKVWVAIDIKNSWGIYKTDKILDISGITAGASDSDPAIVTVVGTLALLENSFVLLQKCNTDNIGVYIAKNITTSSFNLYNLDNTPVTDIVEETFVSGSYAEVFRLHNIRFPNTKSFILGNKINPVITANQTININGTNVTLALNDTITAIVTKINTAAIPNVTAQNYYGKLKLTNSLDYNIALTPRVIKDIQIEGTNPVNNWVSTDYLFFDKQDTVNQWLIKKRDNTQVRVQQNVIDSRYFKNVKLIDELSDNKIISLNIFNPLMGMFPLEIEKEIDYISHLDPANYTSDEEIWFDNNLTKVWWDLSKVRYLDYDQYSLNYKAFNWGKIFPGTSVKIYEWVKSPVKPEFWSDYLVNEGFGKYGDLSIPYNTTSYVTKLEFNSDIGAMQEVYYFWLGNNSFKSSVDKKYSITELQRNIENPISQGIIWTSPIEANSFVFSGIDSLLTENTLLRLEFSESLKNVMTHSHWQLISENENIITPPETIWKKIKDSLVTFNKFVGTKNDFLNAGISEVFFNDLLANNQLVLTNDNLTYIGYIPVPDSRLSNRQKFGLSIRPNQTIFKDVLSARKKLVETINSLLINVNVLDTYKNWNTNLSIKSEFTSTPDFSVATLSERNNLIITSSIVTGNTVFVASDNTRNGKWSFWSYNSQLPEKFTLIEEQSFDSTDYWELTDWYSYNQVEIIKQINDTVASISERNNKLYAVGNVVKVLNVGNNNWGIFKHTGDNIWELIAREKSTIQFLSNLYDFSTVTKANLTIAKSAADNALYYIIDGIYNDLTSTQNKNQLVISLMRESIAQIKNPDWVFKTSLMTGSGTNLQLSENALVQRDLSANVIDYLNEIKPYHSKFRGFIERKEATITNCEISFEEKTSETIRIKFDSVSVDPNFALIKSVLELPETNVSERAFKNQEIREKLSLADRIAIFSNLSPNLVIPGAKFKGIEIDGEGFNSFNLIAGRAGYDNSQYDNIMGYDYSQNDLVSLYDLHINGKTFSDTTNDIVLDGDKFVQPYLTDNRPDQLVVTKPNDSFNLSVYTNGLNYDFISGYDTYPYDYDGPSGIEGYDYVTPDALPNDGRPNIIDINYNGDDITTSFYCGQKNPQSNDGIMVYVDGAYKRRLTDYTVDWTNAKGPYVVLNTPPLQNQTIKILSFGFGGGTRVKTKTFLNSSTTVYDLGIDILSSYDIYATINGQKVSTNTFVGGDLTINNQQVKLLTTPINQTVVITIFTSNVHTDAFKQADIFNVNPIVIANASKPIIPAFVNNFIYMNSKRLLPPYTRYYDVVGPGVVTYGISEVIRTPNNISVWLDGLLLVSGLYSVNLISNTITLTFAPNIGQVLMIELRGNEEFSITASSGVYNQLTVFNCATATNQVEFVDHNATITIDSNVITFTRPDGLDIIPSGTDNLNVITGSSLATGTSLGISTTITINGVSIVVSPGDTLQHIVDDINLISTLANVEAIITPVSSTNGQLTIRSILNKANNIVLSGGFSSFGITNGSYLNAETQISTVLGVGYYAASNNGLMKITKKSGTTMNISDTIFGFDASYTNAGKRIQTVSYIVDTPLSLRTQVYQGNSSGLYPLTANNYSSIDISGDKKSLISDYIGITSKEAYQLTGYNTTYYDLIGYTNYYSFSMPSYTTRNETIIINTFNSRPTNDTIGFRYFKDINEKWETLRISDSNSTILTKPLYPLDTEVVVEDATILTQPNIAKRIPGVVFVNEERIIYWVVDTSIPGEHKLKQLLRGTGGTPWGLTYYPIDYISVGTNLDTVILSNHGLRQKQPIRIKSSITLPNNTTVNTVYFVKVIDKHSFNLYFDKDLTNLVSFIGFTGQLSIKVAPGIVRDAGINQLSQETIISWEYTPNGSGLSNSNFNKFLQNSPAGESFNG